MGGDIRLALRRLGATPLFTTFAILSLAVGVAIGAAWGAGGATTGAGFGAGGGAIIVKSSGPTAGAGGAAGAAFATSA